MSRRGPYLTLLAVAILGLVLLGVNLSGTPSAAAPAPPAAAPAAQAPAPAPAPPAPAAVSEPFPAEAKYTGYTEGNHAAIAVTVRGGKVAAYLCDGKATEAWYQGSAADGKVDAKGGGGANTLNGTLAGSTLTGTVTAGGKSWSYSAAAASAPAGLYRTKAGERTTGWIKDKDGKVTGLSHRGTTVEPAAPLNPSAAQFVSGDLG